MRIYFRFSLFLLSLIALNARAQVINGYARVTGIASNVLTVASVDESGDTFEDGDALIIMQMQDDVIGANTGNNASFGDVSSIASAGLYEIRYIASHTETAGVPTSITLTNLPTNTYNVNANASVQVITFPTLGSPHYTTTGNHTSRAWNGNNGGVLAFNVDSTLTLAHDLDADNNGFRGGARSTNFYSGGTGCTSTGNYIRTANHSRAGEKGEGIYRSTNIDYQYARGKRINGGGGGAERINAGGGGGGNFSAGGNGGYGWSCATAPGGGGVGGADLSAYIAANRIFMGGGGGGGQQNNSASTAGSSGGGIVIIKANEIITTGACGGRTITANALNAANGGNDGQGGGGAGGSIVLQVDNWAIAGTCPLTVEANGGNGGSVNSSTHAAGGGGGQGLVIYSSVQPTTNVTTNTNIGSSGCNNNSNPCTNQAPPPSGSSGSGIFDSSTGPLPIELLFFTAEVQNEVVLTSWQTASEINNDYFEIQRSADLINWNIIGRVMGSGNSREIKDYTFVDENPLQGYSYYRLKQVDYDGMSETFKAKAVFFESESPTLKIFPSPLSHLLVISDQSPLNQLVINIYDLLGRKCLHLNSNTVNENSLEIDVSTLPKGFYFLEINRNGKAEVFKVYKE